MPIQNSLMHSPLGILEIKASDAHVTSVLFSSTIKKPGNIVEMACIDNPGHPLIRDCMIQLKEYFEGKRTNFDLPIREEGTIFQQNVWTALLGIPYGKTISYLELSRRLGNVKAIRAVGSANGRNPVSIIVPCHRVIGSNGDLTGYGGDLWRKRWLLDHEAKYGNGVQRLFT